MVKRFLGFIFLIILTVFSIEFTPSAEAATNISNGQLYLGNERLEENGPYLLNGEWEFYWQQLLTPEDFAKEKVTETKHVVTVPNTWSEYVLNGEQLPKYGYASYRLTIDVHEEEIGKVVSIYIPSIATAYRLWANGELIASQGEVGKSRERMIPKNYGKVMTFTVTSPQIEILLQVSNFHQRKAGIWEPLIFGTTDQVSQLREKNIMFQTFVIGCIFLIGIYHLMMFYQRPKALSSLFISIACFGVTIRTMMLKDGLLLYLFPQINWEIAVSLEYISGLIALLFFVLFIKDELAINLPSRLTNYFVAVIFSYSLFVLVTPARIFTNTFFFLQILTITIMLTIVLLSIIGVKRKREGAYLNLLALFILFLAILNDLFYYSHWISSDEFISLGLLFYLFTQSVQLTKRLTRSFDKVEKLSAELQMLNHSLELKVEKRTKELQEANVRLQKIEQSRRRLLASVSHELKTPLTFIQGYIKAMIDGVISKDDSTYLRGVYRDTQMMAHIITDLQELSKLESGQVTFSYEEIDMRAFLHQLYEEQKPIIERKELELAFKDEVQNHCSVICLIDPLRIKQAYMNFIVNAEKFTPKKGRIRILVEILAIEQQWLKVSIQDSGVGIAEKDLPYLFERFYKASQLGEPNRKGAGLGLAIAKEIIEYHKGTVGVNSEQGKGSEFYFLLPIKKIIQGEREEK